MKKLFSVLIFLVLSLRVFNQVVYEDVTNTGIYEFLDELANLKIITLNSAIKPYSRSYIAARLAEAKQSVIKQDLQKEATGFRLSSRQRKELDFYLQDFQLEVKSSRIPDHASRLADQYAYKLGFLFPGQPRLAVSLNPLGIQYKDSLFTVSIRPILGLQYIANQNGTELHKWWGASMFGYIGKNIGFYASLRDNNESAGMEYRDYFTLNQGQVYKPGTKSGVDFSEMKGGVTVSWNWGSFGLIKDRFVWGNNYHGANIFSGKAPSFPYVHLHVNPAKWFDFNYIHGWLNSGVVDSSRSYFSGSFYREVFVKKFVAANMFTFIPWRGLNVSVGNSIIYSDAIQPVFLIPFMFFNSVDATNSSEVNNAGQNSQVFFDISTRQIRHLNLWASLFIDELKFSRILNPNSFNWTSWKIGSRLSDWPVRNLSVTGEWTKTNPITYKHYISTTTFASNDYCMGSYLRDNSMEIYCALAYKPFRGLHFNLSYTLARHGDEYIDTRTYNYDILGFMKHQTWQNQTIELTAKYEFVNNGYFYIGVQNSNNEGDVRYEPELMHGKTMNLITGINVGF
ncbi:MAG: hypothetical protein WCO44_04195 [Bacteroidota bacterium]